MLSPVDTEKPATAHRVVEFRWLPKTKAEWAAFTAVRLEAGRLWTAMVKIHSRIRRLNWKWPNRARWEKWARGKFPALSAQSVQHVIKEFCDTISATTAARKAQKVAGLDVTAKYPWRSKRYRDVPYTNQDAVLRGGKLRLSNGRGGTAPLRITLSQKRQLPGRIMEVRLAYGVIRISCEIAALPRPTTSTVVGVDLGVNTLIAATDGVTAVLVSGREAKSIVRWRNKSNADLRSRIDRAKPGSKRRKKLVSARYAMADKSARKLKDLLHKATRIVADTFPDARVVVGKPFNDAAQKMNRRQAQQVSQASDGKIISLLDYKMAGTTEVPEPHSSQTCPVCGCRQKCRRVYKCQSCGFTAPRDVVGALNIRTIGQRGALHPDENLKVPSILWRHPCKYPGPKPGSPGGTPAQEAARALLLV